MATPAADVILTVEEFLDLDGPDDGSRMELSDGRLVVTPPPGGEHGVLANEIGRLLGNFVAEHRLGRVLQNAGFVLRREGRRSIVYAPDVAFVALDQIPPGGIPRSAIEGAPTLAVEIISPSDRPSEVRRKLDRYLASNTPRVWVVEPLPRTITVYGPGALVRHCRERDTLTSADAGFTVEGFTLAVGDVFE